MASQAETPGLPSVYCLDLTLKPCVWSASSQTSSGIKDLLPAKGFELDKAGRIGQVPKVHIHRDVPEIKEMWRGGICELYHSRTKGVPSTVGSLLWTSQILQELAGAGMMPRGR